MITRVGEETLEGQSLAFKFFGPEVTHSILPLNLLPITGLMAPSHNREFEKVREDEKWILSSQ